MYACMYVCVDVYNLICKNNKIGQSPQISHIEMNPALPRDLTNGIINFNRTSRPPKKPHLQYHYYKPKEGQTSFTETTILAKHS